MVQNQAGIILARIANANLAELYCVELHLIITRNCKLHQHGARGSWRSCTSNSRRPYAMLAAALVVHGLMPPATVVTARPLATTVAPRVAVARPPPAPVHRSRFGSVRLQAEDDEASGGDSEPPRRSAVLLRRLNDVLFLLFTIAIQAIGAASVIGRPACTKQA